MPHNHCRLRRDARAAGRTSLQTTRCQERRLPSALAYKFVLSLRVHFFSSLFSRQKNDRFVFQTRGVYTTVLVAGFGYPSVCRKVIVARNAYRVRDVSDTICRIGDFCPVLDISRRPVSCRASTAPHVTRVFFQTCVNEDKTPN